MADNPGRGTVVALEVRRARKAAGGVGVEKEFITAVAYRVPADSVVPCADGGINGGTHGQ